MQSRRYIKRIWRVPKDRGATEAFATLTVKALRKHGWPAEWESYRGIGDWDFCITHKDYGQDCPQDFWNAVEIALRVMARIHRVEIVEWEGRVSWVKAYTVNERGEFRAAK